MAKKTQYPSEYRAWCSMKQRCYTPSNVEYQRWYGPKGITVSDEWLASFDNFMADMGPKPSPRHSLDRSDGTKGYSKDNCRWATAQEQARNRSSNTYTWVLAEQLGCTSVAANIMMSRVRRFDAGTSKRLGVSLAKAEIVRKHLCISCSSISSQGGVTDSH